MAIYQYSTRRRIEVDTAHRVPHHGSKCFNLHGHRYVFEALIVGELVADGEERGMVMDFSFIKEEMIKHIHDNIDHAMVLWQDDELVDRIVRHSRFDDALRGRLLPLNETITGTKLYIMDDVPTAENMAKHFFEVLEGPIALRSRSNAHIAQLDVYETPNCLARYPHIPLHNHD